jgi:hypothetical protein
MSLSGDGGGRKGAAGQPVPVIFLQIASAFGFSMAYPPAVNFFFFLSLNKSTLDNLLSQKRNSFLFLIRNSFLFLKKEKDGGKLTTAVVIGEHVDFEQVVTWQVG